MKTRNVLVSLFFVCFFVNSVLADNNSIVGTRISASGEKVQKNEEVKTVIKEQKAKSLDSIVVQEEQTVKSLDKVATKDEQGESELPDGAKHLERRVSSPFQIQILHMVSSTSPTPFAPGGGIHLGYQISENLYLGLTSVGFLGHKNVLDRDRRYEYDDDGEDYEVYGQDNVERTVSELSPRHLLELRIMPLKCGVFFSIGGFYQGEDKTYTEFKNKERTIGNTTTITSLRADVVYKESTGVSTGAGFNYIFKNGLTLGAAAYIGSGTRTPNVTVTSGSSVNQDDLDYWENQIETNEEIVPYLMTWSVGYRF